MKWRDILFDVFDCCNAVKLCLQLVLMRAVHQLTQFHSHDVFAVGLSAVDPMAICHVLRRESCGQMNLWCRHHVQLFALHVDHGAAARDEGCILQGM